jgi:membrane-bound lytic murein transglycosylase D
MLNLNSFVSFNAYLWLNGLVAIAYIVMYIIFRLPFFKEKTTQAQRLNYVRYIFCTFISAFFIILMIMRFLPFAQHSNFILEPFKNHSLILSLSQDYNFVNQPLGKVVATPTSSLVDFIILFFLLLGCVFFLVRYIKNIMSLQNVRRQTFCQHKINNVHILISQTARVPFCWSFVRKHFVVLPHVFLERRDDLKLALCHELQHVRQGDTYWLHFLWLFKVLCFWNPFVRLWINWLDELQEFSCDEAMVLHHKTAPVVYAECLVNVASSALAQALPQITLGIHGLSQTILYRRINMLFKYSGVSAKKISIWFAYIIAFFVAVSTAYACSCAVSSFATLTTKQMEDIVSKSQLTTGFQIVATSEVVSEINNIRQSTQARTFMHEALQRMQTYRSLIQTELKKNHLPDELLAVPLVESGYVPLDGENNLAHAAGIWQFVPDTARYFGLIVNDKRDDRFDINLSTKAAIAYLQKLYAQFHDWQLAVLAYEYGERYIDKLIKDVGSRDAWVIAKSPLTPKNINMEKFLSTFDAAVIIIRNPSLLSK